MQDKWIRHTIVTAVVKASMQAADQLDHGFGTQVEQAKMLIIIQILHQKVDQQAAEAAALVILTEKLRFRGAVTVFV